MTSEPAARPEPVADPALSWDADVLVSAGDGDMLAVDIEGFEGPLDLMLALARTRKLDLAAISMLDLADQYLSFIQDIESIRLELAGDYLVMAAWLTFLKSRLLIPADKTPDGEPTGEELASRLAFRLLRLDAMRTAAARLLTRRRLGRDVFARGMPEHTRSVRTTVHTAKIFDLLKAYSDQRLRTIKHVHVVKARTVWSIKDARRRLEETILKGARATGEWVQLDLFMDQFVPSPGARRTVIAAAFGASLELAREGYVDLQQERPFAAIFMRRRDQTLPRDTIGGDA